VDDPADTDLRRTWSRSSTTASSASADAADNLEGYEERLGREAPEGAAVDR
jgi:hypothetical protein